MERVRLDQWLVDHDFVRSRNLAQAMIRQGQIEIKVRGNSDFEKILKPSWMVPSDLTIESVRVLVGAANRFVSRGGLKLEGALDHTKLSVKDFKVLDVGISTGGFTDCLLKSGVSSVVGIDVGHDQLAKELLNHSQVKLFEGLNVRHISESNFASEFAHEYFDLIVIDVSFISLELVFPSVLPWLKRGGYLLSLIKPQFEVGQDGLSKNGIVKEPIWYDRVREKIVHLCDRLELNRKDYFSSRIEGSDGNKEFFLWAQKKI